MDRRRVDDRGEAELIVTGRRAFAEGGNARLRRLALGGLVAVTFGCVSDARAAGKNVPFFDGEGDGLEDEIAERFVGMPPELARGICILVVANPGVLVASVDMTALSSDSIGGRMGRAIVLTLTSSNSLVLDAPAAFRTMPAGNVPPTTFSGKMRGNGATQFLEQPAGAPVKLKRGVTDVDVSLTASAQGGTYPSGSYATEAVLRCE